MNVLDLFRSGPSQRKSRIAGKQASHRVLALILLLVLVACGAPQATPVVEAPTATPAPPTATAVPPTAPPPTETPLPPTATPSPEPPTVTFTPEPPAPTPTPEAPTPTPGPLGWTQKADLPTAKVGHAAAVVDGNIYVIGGLGGLTTVQAYDAATDTWTQKADLSAPTYWAGASEVDGKIYVIGGVPTMNHAGVAKVWEYSPQADLWQAKADMPTARTLLFTSAVDGKIYAMGGLVWDNMSKSGDVLLVVEEYDPATDTWARKADMPSRRNMASAVSVNGKVYVLGGMRDDLGQVKSDVFVYDPASDTWAEAADMPAKSAWSTSIVLDGLIYVFGGADDYYDPAESNVWVYDPSADSWTEEADMPFERWGMVADQVDGKVYLIGGTETEWPFHPYLSEVWEYDPGPPAAIPASINPTKTPRPTRTPRPTYTPIPTARPLADGECIAYDETPSFNEQEVCVEGRVGIVYHGGGQRKMVTIALDRGQDLTVIDDYFFYGLLWPDELEELAEAILEEDFPGTCVRISGPIERHEGWYRIKIEAPEQLAMIVCAECSVPDACELEE